MKNIAYLIALQMVDGLGSSRLKILLDFYQDPQIIWQTPINELRQFSLPIQVLKNFDQHRQILDPAKEYQKILNSGIQVISILDTDYPESLKQIHHPPVVLYYVGKIPNLISTIGVVGTRKISSYGRQVTRFLTEGLVNAGFTIVSGLARGIDTVAHQTTIDTSGQTIAVLGGGLNNIFPAENIALAQKIARSNGAIMSEYHPDAPSIPGNFPARNRIIAGLSQAILVTEAAVDSGSLITARVALDQGKQVYAVPGPITSVQSLGALELIRDGASLVTRVDDILADFGHLSIVKPVRAIDALNQLEYRIISELAKEKKHMNDLTRLFGLPPAQVAASLLKLEIEGFISNQGDGTYIKNL